MGKIKSKMVKRAARELEKKGVEFSESFEENKKTIGNTMPSKKIKNQLAGYLARLNKKTENKK